MDRDFEFNGEGLARALSLLNGADAISDRTGDLAGLLPEKGVAPQQVLELLAPHVVGRAARLGDPLSMAHMDPPTPWITWAMSTWNAALNQNLLHPSTSPAAREIEERTVEWLAPWFGMRGGHMVPGSTVANLTGLWAARECAGVQMVVASDTAHISIAKAAHILGLPLVKVATDRSGALIHDALPLDLERAALVLTAGATITGSIDALSLAGKAAWTHIDAAWAGPLRLSSVHSAALEGIQNADSVAVSAHKWLFQPKESALIFFRDVERAHSAIAFDAGYLAASNVGLLGSHGAAAVPLFATLLSWGREGLAERIDRCMRAAGDLAFFIHDQRELELLQEPSAGVLLWRTRQRDRVEQLHALLPDGSTSLTTYKGNRWLRNVAANPNVDVPLLTCGISEALTKLGRAIS